MRSPTIVLAGRVGSQGSTGGVVVKHAAGPRAPKTAPLPPSDRPRRGRPEPAEATAAAGAPPRPPGNPGPRGRTPRATRTDPPAETELYRQHVLSTKGAQLDAGRASPTPP